MEAGLTSINGFKNHFTSVRPTLFKVDFLIPSENKYLSGNGIENDKIKYMYIYCNATSLPATRIDERTTFYFGRAYYEAGDQSFQPLELNFYNSQDFGLRSFFERWMNKINKRMENEQDVDIKGYDYFLPSLNLLQLNRRNEVIKKYVFCYLFPIECSDIRVAFDATNAIEEFTVSLRYQYWYEETGDDLNSSSLQQTTSPFQFNQTSSGGLLSSSGNRNNVALVNKSVTLITPDV